MPMGRSEEIERCLVCHNVDCSARGSVGIGEEIAERLAAAESRVEVTPYDCFGACAEGPNLVLYPEGTWYSLVQQADAEEIAQHIVGGPRVDRLTGRVDAALRGMILEILDCGLGRFYD